MARGRMLSKTLSVSKRFNSLPAFAGDLAEFSQLLFALLVPHVDDFGRMTGDPFSVKMTVLPASDRPVVDFTEALLALHNSELITVYTVNSDNWLQVNKFDDHQIGLHKRTESKIPAPEPDVSRKFPEIPGNSGSRARAELNLTELNLREENRTEDPQVSNKLVSSNGAQLKAATPRNGTRNPQPDAAQQLATKILNDERIRKRAHRIR